MLGGSLAEGGVLITSPAISRAVPPSLALVAQLPITPSKSRPTVTSNSTR
jgi:hypothetical protein